MRCRIPCGISLSLSLYIQSINPIPITSSPPPPPSHQLHHQRSTNPPPISYALIHQKPLPRIPISPKINHIPPSLPSNLPKTHHPNQQKENRKKKGKKMCLIHQIRCRCGHNGNIQTRCPDNPGRGFTPRCRAHGIRNTGRAPLAGASHSRTSRAPILAVPPPLPLPSPSHQLPLGAAAAADRTQAGCPRCHEPIYLWGVGREMEALGM